MKNEHKERSTIDLLRKIADDLESGIIVSTARSLHTTSPTERAISDGVLIDVPTMDVFCKLELTYRNKR